MKTIVIFAIIAILVIAGMVLIVINLGIIPQDQSSIPGNYIYEIQGDAGGAGPHTKTDLLLKRINNDNPSDIHIVDMTKDLHYTDHIMFWDWQIHTFENYVFVTWITSEQSWSDVFMAISTDYGKTFDVKNISQSRNYSHEYLVKVVNEDIYFVWLDQHMNPDNRDTNHIYFTKSNNHGKSFSEPVMLSSPDLSSYEFDLEANEEIVFVSWRQDFQRLDPNQNDNEITDNNIFFANIFDHGNEIIKFPALHGGHVDFALDGDIVHGVWSSVEDSDKITYGYSEDFGKTFTHSRIIFDADWETSPYAPIPEPRITVNDEIIIEWRMHDAQGEDTPYKIIIME